MTTLQEIHETEQMEAAKEEFDRLWREATVRHSAMAYMLSALAYLTARTLAREVFMAMMKERGLKLILFFALAVSAFGQVPRADWSITWMNGQTNQPLAITGEDQKTHRMVILYVEQKLRPINGTNMFTVFPGEMIVKTNYLRESITNGEVCKIVGHCWQDVFKTTLLYEPNGGGFTRRCAICQLTQHREMGDWK